MSEPRLAPREGPYPKSIEELLASYPQGPEGPIRLFRTIAHSERALRKIGSAGLLDKGSPLHVKHREIVILRTSYRCRTAYEWGIHVKAFSKYAGLNPEQVSDTCRDAVTRERWEPLELTLLTATDELCESCDLTPDTWEALRDGFSVEQIFEILMLVGSYHTIAFFNNVFRVEQEPGTPVFAKGE